LISPFIHAIGKPNLWSLSSIPDWLSGTETVWMDAVVNLVVMGANHQKGNVLSKKATRFVEGELCSGSQKSAQLFLNSPY